MRGEEMRGGEAFAQLQLRKNVRSEGDEGHLR